MRRWARSASRRALSSSGWRSRRLQERCAGFYVQPGDRLDPDEHLVGAGAALALAGRRRVAVRGRVGRERLQNAKLQAPRIVLRQFVDESFKVVIGGDAQTTAQPDRLDELL